MYNIFHSQSKKLKYIVEGEPPPKKLVTEADIVIKKLSEDQLKTNITLAEQLNKKKEFTSTEYFTNISARLQGEISLQDFTTELLVANDIDKLKSKGLTEKDINLYTDYVNLGSKFWLKYRDVNKDALQQQLSAINAIVHKQKGTEAVAVSSRHQEEYLNAVKPESIEMKLLKFASGIKQKDIIHVPCAIDNLPELEKDFMHQIEDYSKIDLKKIRKKARSLGNKIKETTPLLTNTSSTSEELNRKTLWDVKELPVNKKTETVIDKDKIYSCKSQNWYTIKNGQIMKVNSDKSASRDHSELSKLSVDDLKKIPKFSNYEVGSRSNVLFLKNLTKHVDKGLINSLLVDLPAGCFKVKIMEGKMHGQAFVEFEDEMQAQTALYILNGVLVNERPIIAQFGKKKL